MDLRELEYWIDRDVGLWAMWQASGMEMGAFAWMYAGEIEKVVEMVLSSEASLAEKGWDRNE